MTQKLIGIVDHKSGNTQSVVNAIAFLGFEYCVCKSEKELSNCSHIILPGVSSFKDCMDGLESEGFIAALNENIIRDGKYFLGICVGMQILTETGEEFGLHQGLGWVKGTCSKLTFDNGQKYYLPHIGWNEIEKNDSMKLLQGLPAKPIFYFLHSYAVKLQDTSSLSAYANYGGRFLSAVEKDNIFGVQFHPEKSQKYGLKILKNFCEM